MPLPKPFLALCLRKATTPVAAFAVCVLASPALHAQSSYTATVLKMPYKSLETPRRFDIDHTNRVHGSRSVFSLARFLAAAYMGGGSGNAYMPRPGTWAPTTDASVAPSLVPGLPNRQFETMAASDNGVWTLLMDTQGAPVPKLYGKGRLQTLSLEEGLKVQPQAVNDNGVVIGYAIDPATDAHIPFIWENGVGKRLPMKGYRYGRALAINNQGVVAGVLYHAENITVAAKWVNGQMTLPALELGYTGSVAYKINDKGAMVLGVAPSEPGAEPMYVVFEESGKVTPLQSLGVITDFNNEGVVTGFTWDERGKLWKDGVEHDVTELVRRKGAKLAADAVVGRIYSINDSGSMVAEQMTPNGRSVIRLTARP